MNKTRIGVLVGVIAVLTAASGALAHSGPLKNHRRGTRQVEGPKTSGLRHPIHRARPHRIGVQYVVPRPHA